MKLTVSLSQLVSGVLMIAAGIIMADRDIIFPTVMCTIGIFNLYGCFHWSKS